MKVLLTGGGTGGHITPILAVAHELKRLQPNCVTVYVGERNSKFSQLTEGNSAIDTTYTIYAGKFRRYHGESWLRRIVDLKTNALNLRDAFYVLIGFVQSWRLLGKLKPDVVFQKGGFVGVPVGLAAAARHIPIVTHDSDAVPGLANRLVSRWARLHATALPAEYYRYPSVKVQPVGVLVSHDYQPVNTRLQAEYKTQLGLPADAPLILITGGSSGAVRINTAIIQMIDKLLRVKPDIRVIHQVGIGKSDVYGAYSHPRLQVVEFMNPMHRYSGAADVIVTRAGATHLAEFGVQGKACIVIPNPELTGGHQLKNAERLKGQGAAIIVEEAQIHDAEKGLLSAVEKVINDPGLRQDIAKKLQKITPADASSRLAALLVEQISHETISQK